MTELADRIAAAFAAEEADPQPVTRAEEIPARYECITDAWLTDVLCRDIPGAAVTAHRLDTPDDGANNRRRIYLTYNAAGEAAGLPPTVFCKAAQGLNNRLLMGHSGAILCEVTFFQLVRRHVSIETANARYAAYDPETFRSMVVLDDFAGHAEFCDETTVVDRTFAEAQVDLLAAIHAPFYQSPLLETDLSVLPTWHTRFSNLSHWRLEESCAIGLREAGDIIPPGLRARTAEIWPATLATLDKQKHLPATLCHGDTHLKNWYVTTAGVIGLADWGATHRGHWSRDLVYTLTTSLTVAHRRLWERELFARYIARMAAAGVAIDAEAGFVEYRRALLTALAFWTMTLKPAEGMPDMQPPATSLVFIERLAAAVDDHGVLGLA